MLPISSVLESRKVYFLQTKELLESQQFAIGGNWDYHQGSFDRSLDEDNKVWLRIPFEAVNGDIDSEAVDSEATIKLGTPYVLKHLYNEGNDPEASVRVFGALFDQFQSPVDPDADVESHWAAKAKEVLQVVERTIPD